MTTDQAQGSDLLRELHIRVTRGDCMAGACRRARRFFICGEKYAANTFDDDRLVLYAVCARHVARVARFIGLEDGADVPAEAIIRDPAHVIDDLFDHAVIDGALVGFPHPDDWTVIEYLRSIPVC